MASRYPALTGRSVARRSATTWRTNERTGGTPSGQRERTKSMDEGGGGGEAAMQLHPRVVLCKHSRGSVLRWGRGPDQRGNLHPFFNESNPSGGREGGNPTVVLWRRSPGRRDVSGKPAVHGCIRPFLVNIVREPCRSVLRPQ